MSENISKIQEAKILLLFLKYADSKGDIDFKSSDIFGELGKIIHNPNSVDSLLYQLDSAKIIYYEEIGEDGFAPIILGSITKSTIPYLVDLIESVEANYNSLEQRIADILTFNPNELTQKILDTKKKLDEVELLIAGNELLKPMHSPLKDIQKHFKSLSVVSNSYEDVYKNIIRPVQEEGRSGVKATVKWAIISIVISTALSWIISNYSKILDLMK